MAAKCKGEAERETEVHNVENMQKMEKMEKREKTEKAEKVEKKKRMERQAEVEDEDEMYGGCSPLFACRAATNSKRSKMRYRGDSVQTHRKPSKFFWRSIHSSSCFGRTRGFLRPELSLHVEDFDVLRCSIQFNVHAEYLNDCLQLQGLPQKLYTLSLNLRTRYPLLG